MNLFGLHQLLPNVRRALLQNFSLNEYSDSLQLGRNISKHRLVTYGRNAGENNNFTTLRSETARYCYRWNYTG